MNDAGNNSPLPKQELLKELKRLEEISKDIEKTGKSLQIVQNILQHNQLKEKLDKLSQEQGVIVKKIINTSNNFFSKNEFLRLSKLIEEFQGQIKSCKSSNELNELQQKIDDTVDDWVSLFQEITMDAIKNAR